MLHFSAQTSLLLNNLPYPFHLLWNDTHSNQETETTTQLFKLDIKQEYFNVKND